MVSPIESGVPSLRVRTANEAPVAAGGEYVLYWMIAARRTRASFAFDRAVDWARALGRPLLVFEPLRAGYRWASDRLHRFVIEGMADNAARLAGSPIGYFPYVEPAPGHGSGLLAALGARAAVVVTDDFPCFFLPRMVAAAAARLPVRLEAVDGHGLLPIAAAGRVFHRAVDFRRHLQKTLPSHLGDRPVPDPLAACDLPRCPAPAPALRERWPAADLAALLGPAGLDGLPIDHAVGPVASRGGSVSADGALARFLDHRLERYAAARNDVADPAASGLSPFLHFGHLSVHAVFRAVTDREAWHPGQVAERATASRHGWWGLSEAAESFLDELVTWRELGGVFCALRADYDRYASLPAWARATLEVHQDDPRPAVYDLEVFEGARTHDPLWNAAQRELVRDGRMHNYLRMLWGKKILEWTASPREALAVMIELNNRWALDGRDPNSYSGIFWCLGRFDRAWGPKRPIFGKVRFMSSASTRRKLDVATYLERYGDE